MRGEATIQNFGPKTTSPCICATGFRNWMIFYKDKTVWRTQKAMAMLFDCTSDNISAHLQNIYDTAELRREATTEKISVVRREGNRDVNRKL